MLRLSSATSPAVIPATARVGLRWCPWATETGKSQICFWSCTRFGTSRRHELALSGDDLVTGAYSGVPGADTGSRVSGAGAAVGLDTRASCPAHRSATLRTAIKKKTDQNFMGLIWCKS